MWLYRFLSRLDLSNKYSSKLIITALAGISMPLFGLFAYATFGQSGSIESKAVIMIALIFSLLGSILSICLINNLTKPIRLFKNELQNYIKNNQLPNLPTHFSDEIGIIFRDFKQGAASVNHMLEEKNDLTAMLSHNLRSPMVSILGLVKLAENHAKDPQAGYYCSKIEDLGLHQLKLMESILSLINEENRGKAQPKKVKVCLSEMLTKSLSQFELTLEHKQLEIIRKVPKDLQVCVEPYSFSQVVSNLIHNAIKFSKRGDVIFLNASNGGNTIKLSVKDQGIGFSLKNPNILFERFTSERKRGTMGEPTNGLGLYLIKKIVKNHKGSITAQSEGHNKGATFEVNIPVN